MPLKHDDFARSRPTRLSASSQRPANGLQAPASPAGIVETLRQGADREASARRLFRRFHPLVFHFFRRRGFGIEQSQDLTQETFLRVFEALPAFRGESRFETWLLRIARNLLAQELRSRRVAKRRGQEVSLDDIQRPVELRDRASTHGALTQLLAAEQLTKLRSEVIRLPPQMRRCFVLRNAQGLRYREIASVLDISIEAVKVQLYRARSRLRQITATDGELS